MKAKRIVSNTLFTIAFPVIMFVIMWGLTSAFGLNYIGTGLLVSVERSAIISAIMALAIFSQFRNGRFDFSGGAVIVLTAIISVNVAKMCNYNLFVYILVCIATALVLSLIVATVYVLTRVPVVIITIGMGLFYEALTRLVFGGNPVTLANTTISKVLGYSLVETFQDGRWFSLMYVMFFLAVAIFIIFTYFTKWGKEAQMLANNQKVAAAAGINEIKSVYATYIITGLLLGIGTAIYAAMPSTGNIAASSSSLDSVGRLFSYIVPVFMGMYFGSKSRDYIGIIVSALGLAFFTFGMQLLIKSQKIAWLNEGVTNIITGCFTLAIYSLGTIELLIKKAKEKRARNKAKMEEAQNA